MKKNILGASVLALTLPLLLAACGDKKEDRIESPTRAATYEAKYSEFLKRWTSRECIASLIPFSPQPHYKVEYDFYGDAFVERTNYYSDNNCQTLAASAIYNGNIEINEVANSPMGSRELNMRYKQVLVTAQSEDGKKFLETIHLCGRSDFPVGTQVDMTEASSGTLCPLKNSKDRMRYDRYVVDNGTLYLGSGYKENPGLDDPSKRPADLDKSGPFVLR